jgi:hypothetical protein
VKIIFQLLFVGTLIIFPIISHSAQNEYFVTQNGTGTQSGKTLSDAWSISEFNSTAKWSSVDDPDRIDPGDTVHFSGTFYSKLYVQGSGKSGLYITLDGKNANLGYNGTYWGGGLITIDQKSFIRVQNFHIDGNITELPNTSSQGGIYIKSDSATSSEYINLDNNEIQKTVNGVWYSGKVENLTITRNYFHDLNGSGIRGGNYNQYRPSYIKIGGSLGMGNTFVNVGYLDSYYNTDAFVHLDQTSHVIFSYNNGYNTKEDWGMSGLYGNEVTNALVEYNILHDFNSKHHRSAIAFKGDQLESVYEGPYIIRFNHIWNSHGDDESWGDSSSGISATGNWKGLYVYGNYVHDCGIGIKPNISWAVQHKDGYDCSNAYVFSNIISTTQFAGIRIEGQPGDSYDKINYAYIFNNSIYNSGTMDLSLGRGYKDSSNYSAYLNDSAISMILKGVQLNTQTYMNNVIINSRPNEIESIAMNIRSETINLENDYNHYYSQNSNAIKIRYQNDSDSVVHYDWNSSDRPGNEGANDSTGNPYFKDVTKGDFRLTSNSTDLINSGFDMGTGIIASVLIHGKDYAIPWDFAFGGGTIWSASDPDQIVIDVQSRDAIGWDIGAYGNVQSSELSTAQVKNVTVLTYTQ